MKISKIIKLCFFSFLFVNANSQQSALPNILSESEDGFVDMVFTVIKQDMKSSVPFTFDISSNAEENEVSLRISLGKEWEQTTLDGKIVTFKGDVTISRIDRRSDRFIQFMDRAYNTNIIPKGIKERIIFTGISLDGDPRYPRSKPLKIKLFYENQDGSEYAEAYLNINLSQSKVWLNEKDPEYRRALVIAFKK
jgi:hypothetical protein